MCVFCIVSQKWFVTNKTSEDTKKKQKHREKVANTQNAQNRKITNIFHEYKVKKTEYKMNNVSKKQQKNATKIKKMFRQKTPKKKKKKRVIWLWICDISKRDISKFKKQVIV